MPKSKPQRADAERNREQILEVAQKVFAAEGVAVPIDEIAKRAGLGVGTLYRHFPTKDALFLAIVVDRFEHLAADAEALAAAPDPGEAFFGFLSSIVEAASTKKDLTDALSSKGADMGRALGALKARYRAGLAVLLERAQDAGAVRRDVGVVEVQTLVMGTLAANDQRGPAAARMRERLLGIVCDGLRARAGAAR